MICLVTVAGWASGARGFQPVFTYQGVLRLDGSPVNGGCDFQFRLYDQGSGGSPIGFMNASNHQVVNGVFTMPLNFGTQTFGGADRYLEIDVRCPTGCGAYTTLAPRQLVAGVPYAIHAAEAGDLTCSGCIDGNQIPGLGITGDKLANGAVTTATIASGAIVTDDLDGFPRWRLPPRPMRLRQVLGRVVDAPQQPRRRDQYFVRAQFGQRVMSDQPGEEGQDFASLRIKAQGRRHFLDAFRPQMRK